jgi:large subunit ribosomal protein L10
MATLKDKFARATGMVLTGYKGMTVAEITELRDSLRGAGIEYRVVKNTLARIASDGTQAEAVKDSFVGPVGVALGYDDAAQVAKSVLDFARRNEKVKITCGVVDGTFCDEGKLKHIATLPSKEVLLSMLAGVMQAPPAKLVRLLNATVTQFAYALNALKEKKAAE